MPQGYDYQTKLTIIKEPPFDANKVRAAVDKVIHLVIKAAEGRFCWSVKRGEDQLPPVVGQGKKILVSRTDVELPELTKEVYQKYFSRLFGREAHIRLIYDSIAQAVNTKFIERNHVLLRGLAGTAKTEIFLAFEKWLNTSQDFIWSVDTTTLSKAGLETQIIKRANSNTLPPIIKFEEIEKVVNEKNLNCLLQIMDVRGKITRCNARIGEVEADCKNIIWATCNDTDKLRKFADGALWSRFSMRLVTQRPDPTTMTKILTRVCKEVEEEGGWCGGKDHVEIVVDYMWGRLKESKEYKNDYNDPRLGRALLAGGDRLLDEKDNFLDDFTKVCDADEYGEG